MPSISISSKVGESSIFLESDSSRIIRLNHSSGENVLTPWVIYLNMSPFLSFWAFLRAAGYFVAHEVFFSLIGAIWSFI